jgi:hypothetical protein
MIRLIYSIFTWAVFIILYALLILVGWVLVPVAVLFHAYEFETLSLTYHFTWRFMFIFDNYEDGICAGRQYKDLGKVWKQIIYWSCVRNPVNNLRIVPYLSCKIDKEKVRFIGSFCSYTNNIIYPPDQSVFKILVHQYDTKVPQWFFAWHGWYSNFYYQFKIGESLYRFWIGTKIYPTDIYGVNPESYRGKGAGFAIQFKKVN